MAIMLSRQGRFARAATMVVLCIIALAATSTTLAANDVSALADACKELANATFTDSSRNVCNGRHVADADAYNCDLLSHSLEGTSGGLLAGAFTDVAKGWRSVFSDRYSLGAACALIAANRSIAEACEASRDALAESREAFATLCKDSLSPASPCKDVSRVDRCSELFTIGKHVFQAVKMFRDTDPKTGKLDNGWTKSNYDVDCCTEINSRCLCEIKKTISKDGKVPDVACLKNLADCE